jgi:hypothetical protein
VTATRDGYAHSAYAATLTDIGTPRALTQSGGTVLVRSIPRGGQDATGPYPLFACADWAALADDVEELRGQLVSIVLVADPFGDWSPEVLARAFPDVCSRYKEHVVVDLSRPALAAATAHHRRDVTRALRRVETQTVEDCDAFAERWVGLYEGLIARHAVRGAAAFSRVSLERQLRVPGVRVFRADADGRLVGASVWFVDRGVAYYHLAATTAEGYRLGSSYALVAAALVELAAEGNEWASLGAGTGSSAGLERFKRGWSPLTRPAYLCGRVLDRRRYEELSDDASGYFPAYRAPD